MNLELRSVEGVVYEALRDSIVHGDYPPGMRLQLAELADDLGVSTMPIRGAIARLADEGLVHSLPRRGATVAPLDLVEYQELQDLRIGIESVAARYGVDHMEPSRLATMKRVLKELAEPADLDTQLALEWDAYLALYGAAGRTRTIALILELARLTERYLRFALRFDLKRDDVEERLSAVIDACEAQDAEKVAQIIVSDLTYDASKIAEALEREAKTHDNE